MGIIYKKYHIHKVLFFAVLAISIACHGENLPSAPGEISATAPDDSSAGAVSLSAPKQPKPITRFLVQQQQIHVPEFKSNSVLVRRLESELIDLRVEVGELEETLEMSINLINSHINYIQKMSYDQSLDDRTRQIYTDLLNNLVQQLNEIDQ